MRDMASPSPGDRVALRAALREKGFWGLFLFGVIFFHRPLFLGETFFYRDLYLYYLPQLRLFADLVLSGELPLWNPDLHGGVPFLADISNYVFYPSKLLAFLLPATKALSLEIALHVTAAAAAAYLLARILGCRQAAAVIAGAVYGYCGLTLSNANLLVRLLGTPYLPLMLLFWHLTLREGRRRWFVLTLACGLLQVLSGAVEMVVIGFLTVLGWGIFDAEARLSLRRRLGLWWLLCLAVAGLAAVQLAPMIE
ncbi:MAG: YfhO family protein, partial [bacterium]|nr:YfhO family protein [bacterium]